ncbi:hypothetical protein [Halopseudomonas salegens]|uniref:Uncharacterized protein n=1 Tax=Halopseudomonas salegens TaxID=1434072 RepID=A0A1H2HES0_9GAMM|nr:hypothetical protein [Halopseudomonas salegens]SDU30411.1 hypothetical protein SAMN05216210_2994 [Halopseudomonas salegens]
MKKPIDTTHSNGPIKDDEHSHKWAGTRINQPLSQINQSQQKPSDQRSDDAVKSEAMAAFRGPVKP